MKHPFLSAALLAATPFTLAQPAPLTRPDIRPGPLSPGTPHAASPPRDPSKVCTVTASPSPGADDAPAMLAAFRACSPNGTVVLAGAYTVASPLDLTFLRHVDVVLSGSVGFAPDVRYWSERSFKIAYQNMSAFWRFGGEDVNIFGGGRGVLEGNGQAWWDAAVADKELRRPVLLVVDGLRGGSVSGLGMRNSPNWFNLIANSSDIIVSDITISVHSTSRNGAHNTDGWDIYRSDSIVIQNSHVQNGDDCVSFKPNSTNIVIQNLVCRGSHGISVGSLGQYADQFDVVENVYVYNVSMSDASDGARIKVWPGAATSFQPLLNGGGGQGYVRNVTYDLMRNENNDWAVQLTQCYGQSNQAECNKHPSKMTIQDIMFKNFIGTTSKKNDPKVGSLVCSSKDKCINIRAQNISVTAPSGKKGQFTCTNMDTSLLDVSCLGR